MYVYRHITDNWLTQQAALLRELLSGGVKLVVEGDCRSDSPGHSAMYGTYSLLDSVSGKIIATQVVKVSTSLSVHEMSDFTL